MSSYAESRDDHEVTVGSGGLGLHETARNLKSFNKKQQMHYIFSSIRLLSVIKLLSQALTLFGIDFVIKVTKVIA